MTASKPSMSLPALNCVHPAAHSEANTVSASHNASPLPLEAHRYQFFQAVRLLEAGQSEAASLGQRGPASCERVRLRPSTSLGFPTSEVAGARWTAPVTDGPRRAELTTNFLGLVGVTSPLPLSYAQQIVSEEEEHPHLRAFLDIFHHRLLSLLYRSWLRRSYELAFRPGGTDLLSRSLFAMMGLAPETPASRLGVSPEHLLRYAGLLVGPARSAERLEAILARELGLSVRVEQFPLQWAPISKAQRAPISSTRQRGCRLGSDVVLGNRLPDRTGRLKLTIGPLTSDQADALTPGQPLHACVVSLVRLFMPFPMSLLLCLMVPAAALRQTILSGRNTRLGGFSVLGTPQRDTMLLNLEVDPSACH